MHGINGSIILISVFSGILLFDPINIRFSGFCLLVGIILCIPNLTKGNRCSRTCNRTLNIISKLIFLRNDLLRRSVRSSSDQSFRFSSFFIFCNFIQIKAELIFIQFFILKRFLCLQIYRAICRICVLKGHGSQIIWLHSALSIGRTSKRKARPILFRHLIGDILIDIIDIDFLSAFNRNTFICRNSVRNLLPVNCCNFICGCIAI